MAGLPHRFERVADQRDDEECEPRAFADVALGQHPHNAGDRQSRPADAGNDAVRLPASSEVGEAVGTGDQKEDRFQEETTNPADRVARGPHNRDRHEDKAATEGGGRSGSYRCPGRARTDCRAGPPGERRYRPRRSIAPTMSRLAAVSSASSSSYNPAAMARAISSHENEPGLRCH